MTIITFNAKAIYNFKIDKLYRVYISEEKIQCLLIKQKLTWYEFVSEILNSLLFGLGLGFKELFAKKMDKKLNLLSDKSDERFFSKDLEEEKHEFHLHLNDFQSSRLLAGDSEEFYGSVKGKWHIIFEDQSKLKFNFEHLQDMHTAMEKLPELLGGKLEVKTYWNEKKKQYKKIKKEKQLQKC